MGELDWENLSHHMGERRVDLELQWKDVEKAAGISGTLRRRIMSGQAQGVTAPTARGFEQALKWKRGSVQEVLNGGEPSPLEGQNQSRPAPSGAPPSRTSSQTVEGRSHERVTAPPGESELAIIERWSSRVGQTFTHADLGRLITDIFEARGRVAANGAADHSSEGGDLGDFAE
ncbi:hypothetical protein QRX50_31430 [Amycolatopsis carbonis]|uniref:Uncharacterized protein n=1 Tax=Amycolatopsis carbonis TaxID=715471 RepID=A0A9Y2MUR8_9PSEU|nr:hypothetical protein [Amycolatopsis sp. 2-15]WIX75972.1 hypothetical protein QRX50_31430 [Amycolatopsis sp. 2-15]